MSERFQFATRAQRDAYLQSAELAAWLSARRASDYANMSKHIRPEHHDQCVTQRAADAQGALECDAPTFDARLDRKPPAATRIRVVIADDGSETKAPIVDDPRDVAVAAVLKVSK